jgi:hypothetical protein
MISWERTVASDGFGSTVTTGSNTPKPPLACSELKRLINPTGIDGSTKQASASACRIGALVRLTAGRGVANSR